ncbi:MAG: hypothetical protein UV80_C0002G0048 [Candidatus Peregrinibacteria bacterium GW2011_GWF2_43_17]|nr:MAG: hypothetical protein UV80_C0002G0048 [Candidatus Peregrinibacteria bacterium GW2011_GWF2_43_17]KKT20576.1 MAG: hypothetical protein UW03_C0002G0042 [Candidatus Peregrinibacteria bacterium GW2011_GWA2_43_8]HAU39905.1 hypothetical protein [Candidatus Peregrinibacteria bacterium]
MKEHAVTSNEYHPYGRSLNYTAPCGMKGTVGIMKPGEIIEVSTDKPELVRLFRGRLARTVPGILERRVYGKNDTFYLPGNQLVVLFEALDGHDVAYECIFYESTLDAEREATQRLIEFTMSQG